MDTLKQIFSFFHNFVAEISHFKFDAYRVICTPRDKWTKSFCGRCICYPLQWHHNEPDGVSNHQPHDCLLNRLFRRRSKKAPKLRVTGLCKGNSPVTGEFAAQRVGNAENVSIWWRHRDQQWLAGESLQYTDKICTWFWCGLSIAVTLRVLRRFLDVIHLTIFFSVA